MPNMNPNMKIKIKAATGQKDNSDLIGCYSRQDESAATTYSFYDWQSGGTLATGITSDTQFSFSFPNSHTTWNITPTIVPNTSASGPWANDDKTIDADQSGFWTAVAVPVPEGEEHSAEDDDSAASATA